MNNPRYIFPQLGKIAIFVGAVLLFVFYSNVESMAINKVQDIQSIEFGNEATDRQPCYPEGVKIHHQDTVTNTQHYLGQNLASQLWATSSKYWTGNDENTICFKPSAVLSLSFLPSSSSPNYFKPQEILHKVRYFNNSFHGDDDYDRVTGDRLIRDLNIRAPIPNSVRPPRFDPISGLLKDIPLVRERLYTLYLQRDLVDDPNVYFYHSVQPPLHSSLTLEFDLIDFTNEYTYNRYPSHINYHDPENDYYLYRVMLVGSPQESISLKEYEISVWNTVGQEHSRKFKFVYYDETMKSSDFRYLLENPYRTNIIPRTSEDWPEETTYHDWEDSNSSSELSSGLIKKAVIQRYLFEELTHPGSRVGPLLYCPHGNYSQIFDISDLHTFRNPYYRFEVISNGRLGSDRIQLDNINGRFRYFGQCIDFELHDTPNIDEYEIRVELLGHDSTLLGEILILIDILNLDEDQLMNLNLPSPQLEISGTSNNPVIEPVLMKDLLPMGNQSKADSIAPIEIEREYMPTYVDNFFYYDSDIYRDTEILTSAHAYNPYKDLSPENLFQNPFWRSQGHRLNAKLIYSGSSRTIPSLAINHFIPTHDNDTVGLSDTLNSSDDTTITISPNSPLSFETFDDSMTFYRGNHSSYTLPTAVGGRGKLIYELELDMHNMNLEDLGLNFASTPASQYNRIAGVIYGSSTKFVQRLPFNWKVADETGNSALFQFQVSIIEDPRVTKSVSRSIDRDRELSVEYKKIPRLVMPIFRSYLDFTVNNPIQPMKLPSASGGTPPYSFRLAGNIPHGIHTDANTLLGIPRVVSEFWSNIIWEVTDSNPIRPMKYAINIPIRVYPDRELTFTFDEFYLHPFNSYLMNRSPGTITFLSNKPEYDYYYYPYRSLPLPPAEVSLSFSQPTKFKDIIPNLPLSVSVDPPLPDGLEAKIVVNPVTTVNGGRTVTAPTATLKGKIIISGHPLKQHELTRHTFTIYDSDSIGSDYIQKSINIDVIHYGTYLRRHGYCNNVNQERISTQHLSDRERYCIEATSTTMATIATKKYPNNGYSSSSVENIGPITSTSDDTREEYTYRSTTTIPSLLSTSSIPTSEQTQVSRVSQSPLQLYSNRTTTTTSTTLSNLQSSTLPPTTFAITNSSTTLNTVTTLTNQLTDVITNTSTDRHNQPDKFSNDVTTTLSSQSRVLLLHSTTTSLDQQNELIVRTATSVSNEPSSTTFSTIFGRPPPISLSSTTRLSAIPVLPQGANPIVRTFPQSSTTGIRKLPIIRITPDPTTIPPPNNSSTSLPMDTSTVVYTTTSSSTTLLEHIPSTTSSSGLVSSTSQRAAESTTSSGPDLPSTVPNVESTISSIPTLPASVPTVDTTISVSSPGSSASLSDANEVVGDESGTPGLLRAVGADVGVGLSGLSGVDLGVSPLGNVVVRSEVEFVDAVGSSHVGSIVRLARLGITRGCDPPFNTRFCPDRLVSRGELASMLVRLLGVDEDVDMSLGDGVFSDVSGSVHAVSIVRLGGLGVVRGCDPPVNSRFCPDRSVSRGELATMLVRLLGLEGYGEGVRFSDVVGHTHAAQIGSVAEARIARGCNPPEFSRFCPDRAVTRGEVATFLVRAADYL